ncbi:carboxypeptidase-like regulatory domain-containing protein [Mucilaginibacter conchicola]|uniref:Carboxypeptidase-like regulatory domain-containing protein n=1 Tax=Mucilaginibacter conchicola TaxID=2303333 RepID=A0A372NRB9_9SPHI|nr:DUF5686 and carboxypeptidase-like regulatory domain-containing protein [Mucilaginibacter conchicola]RFZ91147.1 carboxypeptidase-like regulatory domain-containing protein [Mucilaginibacter conchicola]
MVNKMYRLKLFILCCLTVPFAAAGQTITSVRGVVRDAGTREPMPFVTITVPGTAFGINTGKDGSYTLSLEGSAGTVRASYLGYETQSRDIIPGRDQRIDFTMSPVSRALQAVVVRSGRRKRYTNRNNPAVELIRKVIAHKKENRMESYSYTQYNQYEKMFFSLSNLSEKFVNKRVFKNYKFMFKNQDSTEIGGKNLLPVYMEEKLSDVFYQKDPERRKQVILAEKQVKYDENFVDNQGLTTYFNRLYQNIDIYDNNISLLGNQLLSPIADGAPGYYKFFITDTLKDQQPNLVELSFTPRNTTDMLFEGHIFITLDGHYAVEGAQLTVNRHINLNFVRRMEANLSFSKGPANKYYLSGSNLKMDFGISKNKGGGILGERDVSVRNFTANQPKPVDFYRGGDLVVNADAQEKGEEFWDSNRFDTLSSAQKDIYKNIDSLQNLRSFRRTMDLVTLLLAGYKNFGWFETGPVNTFYSFNPVEGFRLRLGGRTTTGLSKRYYFETYGAYGFKDERFKYFLSGTYSLNNRSIYRFPQNYIRASYQHDTKIPGQELQFVQEDNFLLSFKRGDNKLWLYNDLFKAHYVHEFENHLSYRLGFKKWDQSPAGELYFKNETDGHENQIRTLRTTEISAELRYAPHEKFYQGKLYRTPIPDKYPILTLDYTQGIRGLWGGSYNYSNITGSVDKRFYLSRLGYTDVRIEGTQIFGQAPFPLLDILRANQSYAFQFYSYNLMNFLEFVSDHNVSLFVDHHFNGFFFNKIPLIRELKWREVINFKSVWGGLRTENNPALQRGLLQFPETAGRPVTYTLDNGPYMEASIGVANIFRLLRVDYVHRFTYLDHPEVIRSGIRFYVKFEF